MVTKMKKTKCMGTSKNKRAMSGGRGKIGKYTQKFKRSYNRFVEIEDKGDVDSRFKKMDEWGRMRNIYNFLKIQNDKYKGSAGTETTAWEKMKEKADDILSKNIPEFPKEVGLKLPSFNKIEMPKLKKVE
jgi:hypothetical protein